MDNAYPDIMHDEQEEAAALAEAFSGSSAADRDRLARIVDLLPCYVALVSRDHRILFRNKTFDQYFGPPWGTAPVTRPCAARRRPAASARPSAASATAAPA